MTIAVMMDYLDCPEMDYSGRNDQIFPFGERYRQVTPLPNKSFFSRRRFVFFFPILPKWHGISLWCKDSHAVL